MNWFCEVNKQTVDTAFSITAAVFADKPVLLVVSFARRAYLMSFPRPTF